MNNTTAVHLSAQEISHRFKIPYSKINYYTYLGLFEIARKDGNKRFYDSAEIEERYQAILKLMNEGYPLALIRKKLIGGNGHELL